MKSLRQHRRERLWTMRDLEQRAHVSHQTMVSAEAGKPVRLMTMRKIAEALGVDPMEITEFAAIITEDESP